MDCNHKPVYNFKQLFARNPRYTCQFCGEPIEMTQAYASVYRIVSMLLIMLLLLKVLSNTNLFGLEGTARMVADLGVLVGIVVVYLGIMALLTRIAKYQVAVTVIPTEQTAEQTAEPNPQDLTPEQQELIALYKSYEEKAGIEPSSAVVTEVKPEPAEVDDCEHAPAASWKNFIPGQTSFNCAKCGKPITFVPELKKRINMILMLVSMAIILPFFSNLDVNMWYFALITVGVLVVGSLIQFYFVRRGRFERRDITKR